MLLCRWRRSPPTRKTAGVDRIVRSGHPVEIEADEAIQKAYLGLDARRAPAPRRVAAAGQVGHPGSRTASPAPGGAHSVSHKEERAMELQQMNRRVRPPTEGGFFHPFARSIAWQPKAPLQSVAMPVLAVEAAAVPRLDIPTTGGFVNPQARRIA